MRISENARSAEDDNAVVESTLDPETHVGTVEFRRGKYNFFNVELLTTLAETFERLADEGCRAIVLRSSGRHFCAGANFGSSDPSEPGAARSPIYDIVPRLFAQPVPIVAAIGGAAVGGGLGLALVADFRVASPEARFAANFAKLGISQGFALSLSLPRLIGVQRTSELLFTGRNVHAEEALKVGLCDRLVEKDILNHEANAFAQEIASSAPLAVAAIRKMLRGSIAADVTKTLQAEWADQTSLKLTADFGEGVSASKEKRSPVFHGQ